VREWPTAPRRPSWSGPRTALKYTDKPIYIKALSFAAGEARSGLIDPSTTTRGFPSARSPPPTLRQAGITDPRNELAMAEVHDCFTRPSWSSWRTSASPPRGTAWKEVLAGTFDRDGALPVNPDGGLKSFGHPVGASGLRMFFEAWLQLRGRSHAGAPDHHGPEAGPHPQPGWLPGEMVSFVSVVGTEWAERPAADLGRRAA